MIVFVNGPFGVGKSTTVRILAADLPDSLVIDPERIGHLLWAQLPKHLRQEEFELEPVWPSLTRCLLQEADRTYQRILLVPMTIVRPQVFAQIVGALRQGGHDVHHFALLADAPTIRNRLRERGEGPDKWGKLSWEGVQVERCLEALTDSLFDIHVQTADVPPRAVADLILGSIGRHDPRAGIAGG